MPLIPILLAAAPAFVGAAVCGTCHPAQYHSQSTTAHARALARSKPPQPGEWAFGAGLQAITFVRRSGRENYLELGRSWYRALNGYASTPGHPRGQDVPYRIFDPSAAILRCFACHSTGPLTLASDDSIEPRESGVRCEVCHGPGADHARNPQVSKLRNPAALSGDEINQLCGACHRMPEPAGGDADLRNPWNARHQPLMLAASTCFRASQGHLTCFTCHDPHTPLETKLTAYDAACQSCHRHPRHTQPVAGRACAECHMPQVQAAPNLKFANHRIAVYAAADPMSPIAVRR
ncbi:MAG TPA: multiheme c-type cytochrome [Bryobacteraceae bacterium]|nr:multiheme c-type cytochrome [Bryobacteraceae bacterium]